MQSQVVGDATSGVGWGAERMPLEFANLVQAFTPCNIFTTDANGETELLLGRGQVGR